jgi:hypothetical protein
MTKGEDATWFGLNLGPATFNNTFAVEMALMGFAEVAPLPSHRPISRWPWR